MEYWKEGRKRLLRVAGCKLEILKCCGAKDKEWWRVEIKGERLEVKGELRFR